MSKATNMLSILWLLRSGRRMMAQQLADELEIHIRMRNLLPDSLDAESLVAVKIQGHEQVLDLLCQH
ncbi:hypothetical protein [Paenibacillus sp. SYP-B3998]|uniref:hypothetical protein n=1 Tax=Paenibacillus sp. SYP-B3998 TaxID=2678564 RepID=UPI001967D10A|nr:hypothetical protein [Paenibacillus sp. SYP-B3998]